MTRLLELSLAVGRDFITLLYTYVNISVELFVHKLVAYLEQLIEWSYA